MDQLVLFLFIPINIVLGLVILLNNPRSWTNRLFSLLILILTVYLTLNTELTAFPTYEMKLFLSRAIISLGAIINLLVFLFLITFPNDKYPLKKTINYPLLALTIFLFFAGFTKLIFADVIVKNNLVTPVPGVIIPIFLLHTLVLIFGGIIWIFIRYKKSQGIEKSRIRYIFLAFLILFTLVIIFNFIFAVFLKIGNFVPFLPFYLVIFNMIVGYAIIRHRLLDIRLVVARTVSYTLLVAIFALFYGLLFALFSSIFVSSAFETQTVAISTILALIMAFTFQPLRRILEKITDRILYKNHYDANKLLYDLTLIMASTLRLEDLSHELLMELLTQMRITKGAFILTEKSHIYDVLHEGFPSSPEFDEQEILSLHDHHNLLIFEELEEGRLKESLRRLNFSIAASLSAEGEQIGFLVLGEKRSGEIYNEEDIKIIEILTPEAAVAIQNAKAYEEIRRFNITLQEEVDKATKDLQNANEKLKELDKLKDEFVSIASHELRTPMTSIKSYLWMLKNNKTGDGGQKTREYIDRAYSSTDRLINLVNDMLDVSRIESGRLKLTKTSFDIVQLGSDVVAELAPKASEKKINLNLTEKKMPHISADIDKIHQVLVNIIGNAIKFTPPEGKITVSFDKKDGFITTSVSDTGPGISIEDQKNLFQKFSRLENSLTSYAQTSGTGLGLYISKQIIEMLGGKIWVESEVGTGSTFSFSLPLAKN